MAISTGGGRRPFGARLDGDGHGRARGERLEGGLQAAVREHRRVDAAGQLAQLAEAGLQLLDGRVEDLRHAFVPAGAHARRLQHHGQRDESRLGAVVQVALEPAALGIARLDEAGAGRAQLLQARLQLGVEVRDVAAQQPAQEREGHERGRDEGRPPGGVADARTGQGDEQEGEQRGDVDRRELHALEPARPAPAPDGVAQHEHEEAGVEQRADGAEGGEQVLVGTDDEQARRAVLAVLLLGTREEQGRHEGEREDHVAGDGQRAVARREQAPGREAQPEVQEHAAPQRPGEEGKRVDEPRVGGLHDEQEPGEAEQDHERADAALGPPPPRVQAGAHEAPADGRAEDRPHRLGLLVVAGQHEGDRPGAGGQGGEHDGAHPARGHAQHARPSGGGPLRQNCSRYAAFTRAGSGPQRSTRTFSSSARRSEANAIAPPISGSQKRITR